MFLNEPSASRAVDLEPNKRTEIKLHSPVKETSALIAD